MKRLFYILRLSLPVILYLCNSCSGYQKQNAIKDFVAQHGDEDFSIFEGVCPMFYRGTQDDICLLGGIIPGQLGEKESLAMTNIYYNIHDSAIVKVIRARDEWIDSVYASIDSAYISDLTRRFVALKIYEIWVDPEGTIRIQLDDNHNNYLARFDNDNILEKWSNECHWENISGKWYTPKYGSSRDYKTAKKVRP